MKLGCKFNKLIYLKNILKNQKHFKNYFWKLIEKYIEFINIHISKLIKVSCNQKLVGD